MSFRAHYDATRHGDVRALVEDMRALDNFEKAQATIAVHAGGLMLPRGALRLAMWFVGLRGDSRKGIMLAKLYERDPESIMAMWDQTCEHVQDGKDQEDERSVGGWSQREIDLFLELMTVACPADPTPATRSGMNARED